MKRLTSLVILFASVGSAAVADNSFRDTVRIVSLPSPSHYISYASGLEAKADLLDEGREQIKGYGAAIVHLLAVPERWPDDTESIISARLRIADISLKMGAVDKASEQMDLAEELASPEELPLIVRRRLEIAKATGNEDDGQKHAGWLDRKRIEKLPDGQRTPIYLAIVEFYESVEDHQNAGLRAEEFAQSELEGIPAASLRIRAAHSFLAANERAKVRELVADARQDLFAASASKDAAQRQEMIGALHEELDELLME